MSFKSDFLDFLRKKLAEEMIAIHLILSRPNLANLFLRKSKNRFKMKG